MLLGSSASENCLGYPAVRWGSLFCCHYRLWGKSLDPGLICLFPHCRNGARRVLLACHICPYLLWPLTGHFSGFTPNGSEPSAAYLCHVREDGTESSHGGWAGEASLVHFKLAETCTYKSQSYLSQFLLERAGTDFGACLQLTWSFLMQLHRSLSVWLHLLFSWVCDPHWPLSFSFSASL